MMRYVILLILVLVCLTGLAGYRALQVAPYPLGTGSVKESPNGFYEASAFNMIDQSFWGSKSQYYQFKITNTRSGAEIKTHRLPYVAGALAFDFYQEGTVQWNATSTEVTFGNQTTTVWKSTVP